MSDERNLKLMTVFLKSAQSVENAVRKDVLKYALNPTEFSALEIIYHKGSLPISEITKKILISNSTMTYCLDQLVSKKLIIKTTNQDDRRSTYVDLTKRGQKFMDEIFSHHIKFINELFLDIKEEDKELLISVLKKIGYNAINLKEDY